MRDLAESCERGVSGVWGNDGEEIEDKDDDTLRGEAVARLMAEEEMGPRLMSAVGEKKNNKNEGASSGKREKSFFVLFFGRSICELLLGPRFTL